MKNIEKFELDFVRRPLEPLSARANDGIMEANINGHSSYADPSYYSPAFLKNPSLLNIEEDPKYTNKFLGTQLPGQCVKDADTYNPADLVTLDNNSQWARLDFECTNS